MNEIPIIFEAAPRVRQIEFVRKSILGLLVHGSSLVLQLPGQSEEQTVARYLRGRPALLSAAIKSDEKILQG
jgi:hypothetical protein